MTMRWVLPLIVSTNCWQWNINLNLNSHIYIRIWSSHHVIHIRIQMVIIDIPHAVITQIHLIYDSCINSAENRVKEKKRLNHNWTAISDSSSSLIPSLVSWFVCKKTLFIFNVVWWSQMKMIFSKICFISVPTWVCFLNSSLQSIAKIKSMRKFPPLGQ